MAMATIRLQRFERIHHTRRVVGVDDEDADNVGVVLYLIVQVIEVGIPFVVGIELIRKRLVRCVCGFGAGVRGVGR